MKKMVGCIVVLLLLVVMVGFAFATPKASGAVYARTGNTVTIKNLQLSKIKAIEIYDDCVAKEKQVLAPAIQFNLEGCQGFNIVWTDGVNTWYDMITPASKAVGLVSLPDQNNDNCKWVRSDSPQLKK